jgi:hypothetical protein
MGKRITSLRLLKFAALCGKYFREGRAYEGSTGWAGRGDGLSSGQNSSGAHIYYSARFVSCEAARNGHVRLIYDYKEEGRFKNISRKEVVFKLEGDTLVDQVAPRIR